MRCQEVRSWTFKGLVAAFVDLSVAFTLLCAASLVYLSSKLLSLFGLDLPCPCDGLFSGKRSKNKCFQETLANHSVEKISSVQRCVKDRTPFDSILCKEELSVGKKRKGERRRVELQGEVSSSTPWVENAPGFDLLTSQSCKKSSFKTKSKQLSDAEESNPFLVNFKGEKSLSLRKSVSLSWVGAESPLRCSSPVVAEEGDVRSALALELEKERNAAASAADEALSMILRLQEEKASIEMEARQYQRMIEEKSAYDAEEMSILKEILLRREKEKHFLEKEVDTYRQMFLDTEQPKEREEGTDCDVHDIHVVTDEDSKVERNVSSEFVNKLDRSKSVSDSCYGIPPNMSLNMRRNSMSAVDCERMKIESEVGLLRGRLRAVQKGRENISFSSKTKGDQISRFSTSGPLDSSTPSPTMVKAMSMTLDLHSA